jgi:hypothetical protein
MWEENLEIKQLNIKFRDFYNNKISSRWNNSINFNEYMQQTCGFVNIEWHNVICSVMDAINDTSIVIEEYKRYWLWERRGEKLIRLYGLLNALYCQKTALESLAKIIWKEVPANSLSIIELRKIITHITDVNWGKNAYQFTHKINDEYIWLPEHTNRWESKKYNLKKGLLEYEEKVICDFEKLIQAIKENVKSNQI